MKKLLMAVATMAILTGFGLNLPDCGAQNCDLDDIVDVIIQVGNLTIQMTGTLVFAVFIYGGFKWLTSGGSDEAVKKGRTAMTGATVGMFIVFGAYLGVNAFVGALRFGTTAPDEATPGSIATSCEVKYPGRRTCVDIGNLPAGYRFGGGGGQADVCERNLCIGGPNIQCCELVPDN